METKISAHQFGQTKNQWFDGINSRLALKILLFCGATAEKSVASIVVATKNSIAKGKTRFFWRATKSLPRCYASRSEFRKFSLEVEDLLELYKVASPSERAAAAVAFQKEFDRQGWNALVI